MNENEFRQFYGNKSSGKIECNFNLSECTENFSLLKLIDEARKYPEEDYGGFLVCTPKQYVYGCNSSFGTGSHGSSFGRVMKDIHGGGQITTERELLALANECETTYLCGRIVYSCRGYNQNRKPIFSGSIVFMSAKPISALMFESFKKFYEDHKREIELAISNSNGSFNIQYTSKELRKRITTNDLSEVYNYLENHIDYDVNIEDDEEVIVGVSNEKNISL